MLPYWWASSLMRTQLAPPSSDRNTPRTPDTWAMMYSAGYEAPGAAAPKPTLSAWSTADSLVKLAPPLVECHSPYDEPVPPASQTSPSWPGTAWRFTVPVAGRPVAAVAVKLAPPSVDA